MNTQNNKIIAEFYEEHELLYHFDWNWLMEVVDKIESLGYRVEITRHICRIKHIVISEDLPKIQSVHNACVEFIKWYNQQQQPKQYPFNEGDDYWVIDEDKPIKYIWDAYAEEKYNQSPNRIYYQSEEDAHEALLNN